jgi:IclR family acetate operon transcriptional repressor
LVETLAGAPILTKTSPEKAGSVQSLRRALSIMKAIAAKSEGTTLTDIARVTNLATSTAHRLLTTLQQDRFVQFNTDSARWEIGVGAYTIGSAFLNVRNIAKGARPLLRRLMEESGETVNLAILSDDMAVYMEQVESRQTVRAICKPGGRVALHSTSLGKSMLAAMRPEEVARILDTRGMTRLTRKTIDTPNQLALHLNKVRAVGYAIDDEEHTPGLRCVAAAVLNEHGEPIGAISISGPAIRVSHERLPQLGSLVRSIANAVTFEFSGRSAVAAQLETIGGPAKPAGGQIIRRRSQIVSST